MLPTQEVPCAHSSVWNYVTHTGGALRTLLISYSLSDLWFHVTHLTDARRRPQRICRDHRLRVRCPAKNVPCGLGYSTRRRVRTLSRGVAHLVGGSQEFFRRISARAVFTDAPVSGRGGNITHQCSVRNHGPASPDGLPRQSIHGSCVSSHGIPRIKSYLSMLNTMSRSVLSKSSNFTARFM